ncbi:MAG: rod shape-determining protein MreC [Clostridia bacterium]|nr:rod shape-determining protein MreC [Clostridia bacterium]
MRKLWKNRPMWIALIAIILLIVLAAFTANGRSGWPGDGLFRNAAAPVAEFLHTLERDVGAFFTRVFAPSEIQEENARLKETILEQEQRLALLDETEKENARLSELLNFAEENPNMRFVTASVIGRDSNPYIDVITLNAGSRSGVTEKMAVITPDGMVGRVSEVGPNWCRVKTMCDEKLRVSVIVQRTRDEGMLGGLYEVDGAVVGTMLYFLSGNADLRVGDTIRTSGIGGFFPKGLYVGTVIAVNTEGRGTHDAIVSMDVDFAHLENALIVVGVDEAVR